MPSMKSRYYIAITNNVDTPYWKPVWGRSVKSPIKDIKLFLHRANHKDSSWAVSEVTSGSAVYVGFNGETQKDVIRGALATLDGRPSFIISEKVIEKVEEATKRIGTPNPIFLEPRRKFC